MMIRLGPPSAAALAALFAAGCASVADPSGSAHEMAALAPVETAAPAPALEPAATRLASLGLRGVSATAAEPAPARAEPTAARPASETPGVIATAPGRTSLGLASGARAGRAGLADGGSDFAALDAESPAAPPTDPEELNRLLDDFAVAAREPAAREEPQPEVAAAMEPASAPAAEPAVFEHAAAEPMMASHAAMSHETMSHGEAAAAAEPVKLALAESAPPAPPAATEVSSDAPKGEASMWYAGRPMADSSKSPVAPAPSNHPTLEQITQFQYCAPAQRLPGRRLIECQ
jgi:hypothetical protein